MKSNVTKDLFGLVQFGSYPEGSEQTNKQTNKKQPAR